MFLAFLECNRMRLVRTLVQTESLGYGNTMVLKIGCQVELDIAPAQLRHPLIPGFVQDLADSSQTLGCKLASIFQAYEKQIPCSYEIFQYQLFVRLLSCQGRNNYFSIWGSVITRITFGGKELCTEYLPICPITLVNDFM